MATAWLTYAWTDNQGISEGDVDFVIQELERQGISVRFDRRDIVVGQPLWTQIEQHIADPAVTGWIYFVTGNSLASKACREELLYALDRALDKKKTDFPIIGLIKGSPSGLPTAIRVRLYVSTDEARWAERVAAGVRGQVAPSPSEEVPAFVPHCCSLGLGGGDHVFAVHPRFGSWAPFCFGLAQADSSKFCGVTYAASTGELVPDCFPGHQSGTMCSPLDDWEEGGFIWRGIRTPAISSSTSAHIFLKFGGRPLLVKFGRKGGPLYTVTLEPASDAK